MVSLDNTKNLKGVYSKLFNFNYIYFNKKKKGFSFESVTPIHDDFHIENETNISTGIGGGVGAGRTSESQADLLQLTSDLEPDFKKINTTYVILFQIFTIVSISF
jgi:hypothetical protein